jgi:hypothetical protein
MIEMRLFVNENCLFRIGDIIRVLRSLEYFTSTFYH